ncbi:MAG: sigma-70 family RNA polymerase sigma factor [bacterium]
MNDEQQLIKEILAGNKAALQTFIESYQKLVSHVVFRMISNNHDREDLCQEVFMKVYQNLNGFQHECKISTWIARIAHNTCLNYLEKMRVPLLDDVISSEDENIIDNFSNDSISPVDYTETRDLNQRVQDEINILPPRMGVLLALYHLEDMSYEEIAEITSQPMGTVKSYLFRARKMLKDNLMSKYCLEEIWQ